MGGGASVSPKTSEKKPLNVLDLEAIKCVQAEIDRLERASKDTKLLDEYIDATQTYSQTSTLSQIATGKLVTDHVQESVTKVSRYFDEIDRHLQAMREKLCEFKEAVFQRCDQYSEDEKLKKLSRVRQQIHVADELILKAKDRLVSAKKDSKTADMVKTLKRQVQDLEIFKSDLKSSGIDSARSNASESFEKVLHYVIEDILKWRDEALKLRRKYESLLDDNEKLRNESEEEIHALQSSTKKFIKELIELRKETDEADEKVERFQTRVQLIEEKLLDERLSHEVEINSLKAMLERKDEMIARLLGKSNPVTPAPAHGDVRLSPEGIGMSADELDKNANDSRSSTPEKDKNVDKEKENPVEDDKNSTDSFRMWIYAFKPRDAADTINQQIESVSQQNDSGVGTEKSLVDVEDIHQNPKQDDESADIKMNL